MVFIHTNGVREDLPQYWKNILLKFPIPTCDTLEIVHYALLGLKQIFMNGYQYKKVGVIITEITNTSQLGLFDEMDREKRERLMETVDRINGKHGQLLKVAAQGNGCKWKLKQELLSQHFTTNYKEVISINCKPK